MILWALLLIVFWVVAIGVWVLFGDKTNMYYTDRITGDTCTPWEYESIGGNQVLLLHFKKQSECETSIVF